MIDQFLAQKGIPPQQAEQARANFGSQIEKQAMDQFIDNSLCFFDTLLFGLFCLSI